jgi:hypothetical protein
MTEFQTEPLYFSERAVGWVDDKTVTPVEDFLKKRGVPHEEIVNLHNNLSSLTAQLDRSGDAGRVISRRLEKIDSAFSYYMKCRNRKEDLPLSLDFLNRCSTYHGMKATIESAKGNKISANVHRMKFLGYEALKIPAGAVQIGYMGLYSAVVLPAALIDMTIDAYKFLRTPGSIKRVSHSFSSAVNSYMEDRKAKKEIDAEAKSKFYQLVDDRI